MNKFWQQAYPVAWWKPRIKELEQRIAQLEKALHEISLCSVNSMSSKGECGRIARQALGGEDE